VDVGIYYSVGRSVGGRAVVLAVGRAWIHAANVDGRDDDLISFLQLIHVHL